MKELIESIIYARVAKTHLFPVAIHVTGTKVNVQLDSDMGVNVNECAKLNRDIHRGLEEKGIDSGEFHIEVSSPGLDRKLESLREYKKNVGRNLQVRDGSENYHKGLLVYVDEKQIGLTAIEKGKKKLTQYFTLAGVQDAKVVI
ncbi:MAG: ribosome maturation factor [Bacteroidota bacterium]|nr:ribosome maturation factor [Bacteroidota bacterium]